jgi:hypothetical protein
MAVQKAILCQLSHLIGARRFSGLTYSKTDTAVAVAGVAQESNRGR